MRKIVIILILVSVFCLYNHILIMKDELCLIAKAENSDEVVKQKNIITVNNKYLQVPKKKINIKQEEKIDKEDLYWLSHIVSAEAKGECEEGQIAVANVVLNRVKSKHFPNTIKEVIFQHNQFNPVMNGSIYDKPYKSAVKSAKKALKGEKVISENVLYFYNPKYVSKDSWIKSRKIYKQIGNHVFCY